VIKITIVIQIRSQFVLRYVARNLQLQREQLHKAILSVKLRDKIAQ